MAVIGLLSDAEHLKASDPARTAASIALEGAQNEFLSFQICVQGPCTVTNVKVAPFGPFAAANIHVFTEWNLNIATPSPGGWSGPTGYAMIPIGADDVVGQSRNGGLPLSVPSGQLQLFWVDLLVPKGAAAGSYTGSVTVSFQGAADQTLSIQCTTYGFALPSTSSVKTWTPADYGAVKSQHLGTSDVGTLNAITARYCQLFLDHRYSLSGIDTGDASLTNYVSNFGPLIDGTARTQLPGAKWTTYTFGASHGGPGGSLWGGPNGFVQNAVTRGWMDRLIAYTVDEPQVTGTWGNVCPNNSAWKAIDSRVRSMVTVNLARAVSNGVQNCIDLMAAVIEDFWPPGGSSVLGTMASWLAGGPPAREAWVYQSNDEYKVGWLKYVADATALQNRQMQWMEYLGGATGEMFFAALGSMAALGDSPFNTINWFGANGGTWAMPGCATAAPFSGTPLIGGSTDIPLSTFLLKQIRQGMQDFEYGRLLDAHGDGTMKTLGLQMFPGVNVQPDVATFLANQLAIKRRANALIGTAVGSTGTTAPPDVQRDALNGFETRPAMVVHGGVTDIPVAAGKIHSASETSTPEFDGDALTPKAYGEWSRIEMVWNVVEHLPRNYEVVTLGGVRCYKFLTGTNDDPEGLASHAPRTELTSTDPASQRYGQVSPSQGTIAQNQTITPQTGERWYKFGLYIPSAAFRVGKLRWNTFMQWHNEESSPKGLGVTSGLAAHPWKDTIDFGKPYADAEVDPAYSMKLSTNMDKWLEIGLHVLWTDDPAKGFVEWWLNGQPVGTVYHGVTCDTGDFLFQTQGLYHDFSTSEGDYTIYETPMLVATTKPANMDVDIPAPSSGPVITGAAPSLSSLTPTTGGPAGGTQVTITGTGLDPGDTVLFGTQRAQVVSGSATSLVVTTPANALGTVDVKVVAGGGASSTLPQGFTYNAPPTFLEGGPPMDPGFPVSAQATGANVTSISVAAPAAKPSGSGGRLVYATVVWNARGNVDASGGTGAPVKVTDSLGNVFTKIVDGDFRSLTPYHQGVEIHAFWYPNSLPSGLTWKATFVAPAQYDLLFTVYSRYGTADGTAGVQSCFGAIAGTNDPTGTAGPLSVVLQNVVGSSGVVVACQDGRAKLPVAPDANTSIDAQNANWTGQMSGSLLGSASGNVTVGGNTGQAEWWNVCAAEIKALNAGLATPRIASVSKLTEPSTGGDLITITGDNFQAGAHVELVDPGLNVTEVAADYVLAAPVTVGTPGQITYPLSTSGAHFVDANGNNVLLRGVNWFGFEGPNAIVDGLWVRTYASYLDQMKSLGFNCIRLPWSNAILHGAVIGGVDYGINPDLQGQTPLQAMQKIIQAAASRGIMVILDRHRLNQTQTSNVPYDGTVPESQWISDWQAMAQTFGAQSNVVGYDPHNEPGGSYAWSQWKTDVETLDASVRPIAPNWIMFLEGVQTNPDNFPGTTFTFAASNITGAKDGAVPAVPSNKLCYSPHEYPQSVGPALPWWSDPSYPNNLTSIWDFYWGWSVKQNQSPIWVGEFGSFLATTSDQQWFSQICAYIGNNGLSFAFWSWNPNSANTGGVLNDDWTTVRQPVMNGLAPLLSPTTANILPLPQPALVGSLTFKAPPHAPATLSVRVVNPDGESATFGTPLVYNSATPVNSAPGVVTGTQTPSSVVSTPTLTRVRTVARLQGGDPTATRMQDQMIASINPTVVAVSQMPVAANGVFAAEDWSNLALLNGWLAAANTQPAFFKDSAGRVTLRGVVDGGDLNIPCAVLPAGYRPGAALTVPTMNGATAGSVQIGADGTITPNSGDAGKGVALDGISFRAEV